ncbi:unnamed protein product [Didymodactylos carnosus]|uniref:Uncharacterized protein n=1 Tax=Didymodactylos carnosus TaxID=1234261 RepID=A0A815SV59_9BILA|nr:unnamed protein product [Didymodactylos carnosus]CAF4360011.1 unnamed protein product [Didymodactylos carnosus]
MSGYASMDIDVECYSNVIPYWDNHRDIGRYSDHLTVWLDKYIGRPEESVKLKERFQTFIHPLNTISLEELEFDEPCYQLEDPEILLKLKDTVYCLKPFFEIDACLEFIRNNVDKKIFFISSGTMGEKIVPQIVGWPQIHSIYIFCGNISLHAKEWAMEYCEHITAMLDHQDDLLLRLTKDIVNYLQEKGDHYLRLLENIRARHCYAWAIKLTLRSRKLGTVNFRETHDVLMEKFRIVEEGYGTTKEQDSSS